MSEFEKLLAELNSAADQTSTLAKSLPADDGEDDQAIQAAAADGDDHEGVEKNPEDEGEEGDEPMAKSLEIDGEQVQLLDADQLIKSISDMGERLTGTEQVLAKALAQTTGMITQQNAMIKSLSDKVEQLSNQGRGRKTVVAITDKPSAAPLAKSEPAQISGQEIMAKCLQAQQSGKLSGIEVARVEQYVQSGLALPPEITSKLN